MVTYTQGHSNSKFLSYSIVSCTIFLHIQGRIMACSWNLSQGHSSHWKWHHLIDRVRVPIYLLCDCGHIFYVIFHTPSTYLPRKTVANTFALLSTTEPDHTYRLVWMDSAKYPLCLLTAEGRYRRTDGQTDGKTISTAQYLLRNVTERSIKRLN